MTPPSGSIAAVVAHARVVPTADRQRFAAELRAALPDGALIIETCHRVEGYVAGAGAAARLADARLPAGGRALSGESAIRHAIAVAVGRDSVVVGEDQVLHQLRVVVDGARGSGGLDPVLERLFSAALRSGRIARSWRQGPERSLGTLAVSSIEQQAGSVRGREVLIVGAGRMGRLAARAALAAGAMVTISSRSSDTAAELARSLGGRAAAFDPGADIATAPAGTIVALTGPWLIGRSTANAIANGSLPVVDLSVPPALPDDLGARLGARLITADDLATGAAEATETDARALKRLDELVDRTTADFLAWLDGRDRRVAAAALSRRAAAAREAELEALWRQLPDLDPDTRQAIDAMTQHFAERLLREPLERLGKDTDGRAERAVREAFAL